MPAARQSKPGLAPCITGRILFELVSKRLAETGIQIPGQPDAQQQDGKQDPELYCLGISAEFFHFVVSRSAVMTSRDFGFHSGVQV